MENSKRSHFNPKPYRIDAMYNILFDAVAGIYGKEKTDLFFIILQEGKQLDIEKLKELPEYNKYDLAEKMLDKLKKLDQPITDLRTTFNHEKIQKLKNIIPEDESVISENKPIKTLRIMPSYQEFVTNYSKGGRLGEVIELAIALWIVESSDFEYELIRMVYKYLLNK